VNVPYAGPDRRTILAADAAGAHSQRKAAEELAALAKQQRDTAVAALREIASLNARATISKLDRPTDFAEAQAYSFAVSLMKELARQAIVKAGAAL
jgi:hypothetical protein